MNTAFDFSKIETGSERLVYVRPVAVTELPDEVQDQAGGRDQVYAVHAANGAFLALVKDRKLAFDLARENDYAPVNVH